MMMIWWPYFQTSQLIHFYFTAKSNVSTLTTVTKNQYTSKQYNFVDLFQLANIAIAMVIDIQTVYKLVASAVLYFGFMIG